MEGKEAGASDRELPKSDLDYEGEGVPEEPRPSSVMEGKEAGASDRELPKSDLNYESEGALEEPITSSSTEGKEAEASDRELPKSGSYGKYSKGEFCELYSAVMG